MFNLGGVCGGGYGNDLWACMVNLIILFVVMEFLGNVINGSNCGPALNCGC